MNTGYDLNSPNKYMQTAFDAFKSNQPATQQAVSQGPQAGLRYLAGLQAQANQQQAQQTQPQALPSTTVLQQLLQKLGQNHGIMAQLPASIDIASAPTQPAMATGGLVSLAAGGPIAFSGGDTVPEPDLDASYYDDDELTHEERMTRRNPEYEQWSESIEPKNIEAQKKADDAAWRRHLQSEAGKEKYQQATQQRNKALEDKALESIRQRTNRDIRRTFTAPDVANKLEYLTAPPPPRPYEVGPSMPTDGGNTARSSGTGIMSKIGKVATNPKILGAAKGIAKALPGIGAATTVLELPGVAEAGKSGLDYLTENVGRWLGWHDTDRPETAAPFVGPTKPTESPVHEPVAKAEPSAAAKQGVKAVSPTEHAKQIEKKAEAPKGKEPQGAAPEEKQYEFDQHRDEYRDDHQPQGQTVSQPTDREYPPAPETSGIASVTPEDMIQHLQQLGGGGYQEDPEVLQMRNEQLESAKANKWANSIAGLIGGIYGGHSPYASENVARGIMTALGQYQAGTQAEDAIRSGIMGSKEVAQKSQASYQQHLLDKFIEAQLAKGRDQADLRRAMLAGDARLGAAEIQAKARQEAAQQRMVENALKNKQYKDAADQRLAVETAKAALRAVGDYVKGYSRGIPSEDDKKRVFLTVWNKLAPNIPITDEEVAGMTGSPPPTGSPGNPTATYGSSSNQISDEDED